MKMVLRTVHLPSNIDEMLKAVAFKECLTKADIIRRCVAIGLRFYEQQGAEKFMAETSEFEALTEQEKEAFSADLQRSGLSG